MIGTIFNADISPWAVGDTAPSWLITLIDKTGTPLNLSGVLSSQLSLIIYNAQFVQVATGAGGFAVTSSPGTIQYNPAAADSATAGTYYLRFRVSFNGSKPQSSDYVQWVVQP